MMMLRIRRIPSPATVAAGARSRSWRGICAGNVEVEKGENVEEINSKNVGEKEEEDASEMSELKLADFERAGKVFGYMLGSSVAAAQVNHDSNMRAGKAEFLSSFEKNRRIFASLPLDGNYEGSAGKGEKEQEKTKKTDDSYEAWNFFELKGKHGVVAGIVIAVATFGTFLYDWYLKFTDTTSEQLKEGAEQLKTGNKNLSDLKEGMDGVQEAVVGVGKQATGIQEGVDQLLKKGEDAEVKNVEEGEGSVESSTFWKWFGY